MASLGMNGPFVFTASEIDKQITRTCAGNYALGRKNDKGGLTVKYVGRADSDVNDRIKDHLGKSYSHFKFCYATSPKAAFEKECENYHDFGGSAKLDNKIHPDRPDGASWKCPRCNKFG